MTPSNLVAKYRDGVKLLDNYRMIVDERGLNNVLKPIQFPLPKLDEIAEYDVVKKEGTTKPKVSL